MSNQKWYSIAATVTKEQKQEIEKRAEASGMNISEYIKARLFIDQEQEINKITNLDKWTIRVMSYIAVHVAAIAQKTLTDEEYKKIEPEVATIVRRSGLLKEDEIFRTKPNN